MVASSTAVRVGRRSISRRFYLMLNKAASSFFRGGVIECSSRMTGNCQVRFLEGWPPAMGAGYSAHRIDPETRCHTSTGETCQILLADASGRTSEPASVRDHAGLYCPVASTAGINAGVGDYAEFSSQIGFRRRYPLPGMLSNRGTRRQS
jgi:hypothetical protein